MNSMTTTRTLDRPTTSYLENELSKNINRLINSTVKCFHHCSSSIRYLCFDLPDKCPTCLENFKFAHVKFKVPPFILPSPVSISNRNAQLPKLSLLLQPSDENYSKFFDINRPDEDIGDLHIGITNSKSEVFDYDSNGLNRNSSRWSISPSIVIKLAEKIANKPNQSNRDFLIKMSSNHEKDQIKPCILNEKWDLLLEESYSQSKNKWNKLNYDENEFNCFDFVVNFLYEFGYFEPEVNENFYVKRLTSLDKFSKRNYKEFSAYFKEKLSNDLIIEEFNKFINYLSFLVKLEKQKCLVERI